MSWAPAGFVPVPIGLALCEPDREWFGKWATHLLVPPAEAAAAAAESGLERPHMDPQLAHNANTYGDFLRRLHEAGMLRWKRTEQTSKGSLGVFFVAKKNGSLRIVCLTRLLFFSRKAPRSGELPSAHCVSCTEMPGTSGNFLDVCDLDQACYEIRIPFELSV